MSIIIKGLNRPNSCVNCRFLRCHPSTGTPGDYYCSFTFRRIPIIEQKPDNCPIEPFIVKRASWIKDKRKRRGDGEIYDYCCSLCQGSAIEGSYGNLDILTDYCPHCGAEMENENETH